MHCHVTYLILVSAAVDEHVEREELGAGGRPHDRCLWELELLIFRVDRTRVAHIVERNALDLRQHQ